MTDTAIIEAMARAIREEIIRQYRDDDRGRCPAGSNFYEEYVAPTRIATAALAALREMEANNGG